MSEDELLQAPAVKYNNLQSYRLIELVAQWEGRLTANHLSDVFGDSRSTATQLIQSYIEQCPDSLIYNPAIKGYEPTEEFIPSFCSGTLDEYMQLMRPYLSQNTTGTQLNTYQLTGLQRAPDPKLVRQLLRAISQKQRIVIGYASINTPDYEDRIISPHSLINDGARWHTRAWCEKNQEFRDFVLSRINAIHNIEGQATKEQGDDRLWRTQVQFNIEPDPRLSPERQRIVALDYDMNTTLDGRYKRTYRVRAALLTYWLQHLRLDRYREKAEGQQIIISPESQITLAPYMPK